MEDGELVQLTSEQVERVFWSNDKVEPGLGIIETGFVAGGLSSLFVMGFELLGFATAEIESDDLVIKCAREEFVRSVIESLPAEVVMIDSKSNIVAVNRSASRSGWHVDENIPRSYVEIATHILGAKGAERIASGIRDVLSR